MTPDQIVEATLFASQTPLTPAELARADEALDPRAVREALDRLRHRYDDDERSFQIYQLGDGFQILTRPEFAPYLERFDSVPRPPTLSRAALETLAIVAYRQPIGRIEVEEIRGVASASVLRTLQDWELIDVVGRGEGLGRPLLYGISKQFLDHFGFQSIDQLPRPDELPIALGQMAEREPAAEEEASGPAAEKEASGPAAEEEAFEPAVEGETPEEGEEEASEPAGERAASREVEGRARREASAESADAHSTNGTGPVPDAR